ncbi:MAG: hypothetical protein ACYDD1_13280 [Caulobacteraceae bacterium]
MLAALSSFLVVVSIGGLAALVDDAWKPGDGALLITVIIIALLLAGAAGIAFPFRPRLTWSPLAPKLPPGAGGASGARSVALPAMKLSLERHQTPRNDRPGSRGRRDHRRGGHLLRPAGRDRQLNRDRHPKAGGGESRPDQLHRDVVPYAQRNLRALWAKAAMLISALVAMYNLIGFFTATAKAD